MKKLTEKRIQSTSKKAATGEDGSTPLFGMGRKYEEKEQRGISGDKGKVPLKADADKVFVLHVFKSQAFIPVLVGL